MLSAMSLSRGDSDVSFNPRYLWPFPNLNPRNENHLENVYTIDGKKDSIYCGGNCDMNRCALYIVVSLKIRWKHCSLKPELFAYMIISTDVFQLKWRNFSLWVDF